MPDLDDPELAERLDELASDGPIYQIIGENVVRYVVERGRHCYGVKVDIESREWENFSDGPAAIAAWIKASVAIHEIEEWGDAGEVPE